MMVIDQTHRLHERVHRRRPDKTPAPLLEIFRQRNRLGRGDER